MLVEVFNCGVIGVGYEELARIDAGTVAVFGWEVTTDWLALPTLLLLLFARDVNESVEEVGIFLLPLTVSSSDSFTFTMCFFSVGTTSCAYPMLVSRCGSCASFSEFAELLELDFLNLGRMISRVFRSS